MPPSPNVGVDIEENGKGGHSLSHCHKDIYIPNIYRDNTVTDSKSTNVTLVTLSQQGVSDCDTVTDGDNGVSHCKPLDSNGKPQVVTTVTPKTGEGMGAVTLRLGELGGRVGKNKNGLHYLTSAADCIAAGDEVGAQQALDNLEEIVGVNT